MFDIGDEILHERFGTGIVLATKSVNFEGHPSEKVEIDFGGGLGTKKLYCPPGVLLKGPFEEVIPEASEEVIPEASEEVIPEASEEVISEASEEVIPEASEEVIPEASEEVIPTLARRMKVRRQWGGPSLDLYNRHLDTSDKKKIKEMFTSSRLNIGTPEDLDYIDGLIDKKLKFLKNHPVRWLHNLGEESTVLLGVLADHREGRRELPDGALGHIAATLFWLVNPMDYFADTDPDKGYIDDAWVLKLCIEHLRGAVYQGRFVEN